MDELEISGKRYISARRAAKEHKYTSDYIGQLIRGRKLVGQKVGRAWYVEADSLAAYVRGEMMAAPTQTGAEELGVSGNTGPLPEPAEEVTEAESAEVAPAMADQEDPKTEMSEEPAVASGEKIPEMQEAAPAESAAEEPPVPLEEVRKPGREDDEDQTPIPLIKITSEEIVLEETPRQEAADLVEKRQTGLRYIEEPADVLPRLQKETMFEEEESSISIYRGEPEGESEEVVARRPRHARPLPTVFLGVVGIAVLAASAALSSRLVSQVEVRGSGPASVVWTLK